MFLRTIGAPADISEIQYISALHQTTQKPRKDGSVTASDISYFLLSRYGIDVSEREVEHTIIKGFGGTGNAQIEECIDIAELIAILLIPFLLRANASSPTNGHSIPNLDYEKDEDDNGKKKKQQQEDKSSNEKKNRPRDEIVSQVLKMIIHDVTGSISPAPIINEALVKKILCTYGEEELASDDVLVNEMVMAATSGAGGSDGGGFFGFGRNRGVPLDESSFEAAITGDVMKYDLRNEHEFTTNFEDVFGDVMDKEDYKHNNLKKKFAAGMRNTYRSRNNDVETGGNSYNNTTSSGGRKSQGLSSSHDHHQGGGGGRRIIPESVFTACSIDTTASTHRSTLSWVLLMGFFLMTQFTYFPDPRETSTHVQECTDDVNNGGFTSFPCIVRNRIVVWINIALTYTIGGTLFIGIGSMGNNITFQSVLPSKYRLLPAMFSIIVMAICAVIPPYLRATDDKEGDLARYFLRFITFILGTSLVFLQLFYVITHWYQERFGSGGSNSTSKKRSCCSCCSCFTKLFQSLHSGNVISECKNKQASSYKTDLMVNNAINIHSSINEISTTKDKSYSLALLNYERTSETTIKCGGFLWTWKMICSGDLMRKEGLWIPSEIIAANLMQLFMTGFVVAYEVIYTRHLAIQLESGNLPLGPAQVILAEDDLRNLVPAVKAAGYAGAGISLCACLAITIAYIPSTIRTMLEFRCGKIPSLADTSNFFKYIVAPHSVSKVTGSMIWAVYYAGVAAYFLYAAVVFIFYYEGTRNWAISQLANIIGFLIPITCKFIVLFMLTRMFYAGLYRTEPAKANFMSLVLQCLDFGLAFGYMLLRSIKMTVVLVFYFGRVDTPFFAPGIASAGAVEVDDSPTIYRRLLVSREAHRHPYLETIGKMYLLKLRHGDNFGTMAGSRWRLIFVSALMPWVRNHRIMMGHNNNNNNSGNDDDDDIITVDDSRNEDDDVGNNNSNSVHNRSSFHNNSGGGTRRGNGSSGGRNNNNRGGNTSKGKNGRKNNNIGKESGGGGGDGPGKYNLPTPRTMDSYSDDDDENRDKDMPMEI